MDVHIQNDANFKLWLGIPDGYYDLNLIFPPSSEEPHFIKSSQAYSIAASLGSVRASTFSTEKPPASGKRSSEQIIQEEDLLYVDPIELISSPASPDTFDTDFNTSGEEDDTDNESEQFDSVHDLILAAFRGEPEIPPDVRRILHRESPAFRAPSIGTEGTFATQPSREPGASRKKPSKSNNFYEPCSGTGCTEIRHLVKHYAEKHGRPQCLKCLEIFPNTQALTMHQREVMCFINQDRTTEEPIDPAVMERIRKACRSAEAETPWTKEEIRLFKMCFILFPLWKPPISPYVGEGEIRLIRAAIDSLENRIQANDPNSPVSMDLRSIIDDLRLIVIPKLGPALETAEFLQQQQQQNSHRVTNTDLNIDTTIDDPANQLWNNMDSVADMLDYEAQYDE